MQGEQTAVTDASGSFEISLLPPGVYKLDVQREGYKPFSQPDLTLRLDKTLRIKLQLTPDSINGPVVEITVQKPVISTTSTDTGGTVSKEQMGLIPYGRNSRTFDQVLTTVPGSHADTYGTAFNGSGSPESNYIVDGVQVNDPAYGIQGTTLLQDFVQEVEVKSGGYQAEFGRSSGGVVNVVTKSGGNDFHGSVFINWSPFEANRKEISEAGEAIASQASQNYNLDFGAELGGPIIKDKLWFYAGFAPQFISTNLDRIIQAQSEIGNTGQAQVDSTGTPITHQVADQRYTNTQTSYQFTGKLTYLVNENHTIAVAVYGNPTKTSGTQTIGASNEGSSVFDTSYGSTDVSARYAGKLFNKQMLVEASVGYHHQQGSNGNPTVSVGDLDGISAAQRLDTPTVQWLTTTNLLNPLYDDGTVPSSQQSQAVKTACAVHADGFDPCPISNYTTGGIGQFSTVTLNRIQGSLKFTNFIDNLLGHHQVKYGVDMGYDTYLEQKQTTGGQFFQAMYSDGVLTSYTGIRGYGHADPNSPGNAALVPGALSVGPNPQPITLLAGGTINVNTNNLTYSGFVQDSWNIMDKGLVLDIGGRLEYQKLSADSNTPDAPVMALTNAMPRIGLTYDWTGRGLSKIFASFGQFYEYVPLDLADRDLSGETQVDYATNPNNCKNPKDPRTCAILPTAFAGLPYQFVGGGAGAGVDPNIKGQYTNEAQLGTEYQAYRDISLGLTYVRKWLGRVIEDMSVNDARSYFLSNPGEPCSSQSVAAGACGQYGVTGLGQSITEPTPRRVYDGITLSINKQFSDNWLLTGSYTWSSYRGNYPGLVNNNTGQLDPNILSEYDLLALEPNRDGPLPGDEPNQFKVDGAYVFEVNSNLSVNLGGNIRVDQGGPLNVVGSGLFGYGPGETYILPRGADGRLPWTWSLNLRAAVAYRLTKDYTLGINVDLFNVTDNRETTSVDQNYTLDEVQPIVNGSLKDLAYLKNTSGLPVALNPTFNQATAYQLPFSARLGAKLSF